jgi:hypothetical protein
MYVYPECEKWAAVQDAHDSLQAFLAYAREKNVLLKRNIGHMRGFEDFVTMSDEDVTRLFAKLHGIDPDPDKLEKERKTILEEHMKQYRG